MFVFALVKISKFWNGVFGLLAFCLRFFFSENLTQIFGSLFFRFGLVYLFSIDSHIWWVRYVQILITNDTIHIKTKFQKPSHYTWIFKQLFHPKKSSKLNTYFIRSTWFSFQCDKMYFAKYCLSFVFLVLRLLSSLLQAWILKLSLSKQLLTIN